MDLNNLIPKHKFDIEKVELLEGLTFDEIEPIIRNLLEWLQDGNWPVSRPLGIFLKTTYRKAWSILDGYIKIK